MWLTFLTSPPRPGSITFGVDVGRHVAVLPPRSRLRYAVSVCAARRTERGSLTCAGRGSPAGRRAPRPFARCARAAARRPWPLRPKTSRRARHRRLSVCSDDGGNRLSRRARHSTRRYSCASSRRLSACRLRRVDGSRAARPASAGTRQLRRCTQREWLCASGCGCAAQCSRCSERRGRFRRAGGSQRDVQLWLRCSWARRIEKRRCSFS